MDLNQAIWETIESRPSIATEAQKRALHVDIMRLVETSRTQVGKKHGVTVMTQEASMAGDKVNELRGHKGSPAEPKPRTL